MPTTSCCGLNQSGVFWKPRIQPYTPGTAHQLFQVRDTDDRVRVLLKNHAVYNELYRSVQTTQVPARQVLPPCAVGQEVLRGSRDRVAEYLNLDVTQRGFEGHRHRSRQVGSARVCQCRPRGAFSAGRAAAKIKIGYHVTNQLPRSPHLFIVHA